jgi:hypothetical protein
MITAVLFAVRVPVSNEKGVGAFNSFLQEAKKNKATNMKPDNILNCINRNLLFKLMRMVLMLSLCI